VRSPRAEIGIHCNNHSRNAKQNSRLAALLSERMLAAARHGAENRHMAIVGHGIDLVDVARVARMVDDHGHHFLDRCFTPAEQAYCRTHVKRAAEHFAGRFAAKESILKVLGTGWRGQIAWTDMEIINDPNGKPCLQLSGESARIAAQLGITRWHLSITHTEGQAMASAIGEG
jgi:holo-[acyl-carrier protein] synthase